MIKNGFLTIGTVNFDKVLEFYHCLFQIKADPYFPNSYAEFQISGLKLGIFRPKAGNEIEFSKALGSGFSLCLEVESLEEMISHLTSHGYPLLGNIIKASHGREIYVYDPDGNRIILHQFYCS